MNKSSHSKNNDRVRAIYEQWQVDLAKSQNTSKVSSADFNVKTDILAQTLQRISPVCIPNHVLNKLVYVYLTSFRERGWIQ